MTSILPKLRFLLCSSLPFKEKKEVLANTFFSILRKRQDGNGINYSSSIKRRKKKILKIKIYSYLNSSTAVSIGFEVLFPHIRFVKNLCEMKMSLYT